MKAIMIPALLGFALVLASPLAAQTPATPYGAPITLAQAKKIAAAAQAEARKHEWPVAIAIVDSGGHLVLLERMDHTQFGSVGFAQDKAKSAVAFRRPTQVFEEAVAQGGEGLRLLKVPGVVPVEGGLPIVAEGKIIGGIGVSGVTSAQDGQIAKAGLQALAADKPKAQ